MILTIALIIIAANQAVGLWLNLYQFSSRARRRKAESDHAVKLWIDRMQKEEEKRSQVWVAQ